MDMVPPSYTYWCLPSRGKQISFGVSVSTRVCQSADRRKRGSTPGQRDNNGRRRNFFPFS